MAEEFPEHGHHYLYQSDAPSQPLIPPPPPPRQQQQLQQQFHQHHQHLNNNDALLASQYPIRARIFDDRTIQQQRRLEHETYVRKSLPNSMRSYGSIYSAHSTIPSESESLLSKTNVYQYPCGVYGEPIELTRYRRNQIFLAFFIIFYVGYLLMGSVCFQRLESEKEQEIRAKFRLVRQTFLADNPSVKEDELEAFIGEVLRANSRGISALRNATSEPNWSFAQSLFFSTTVVTTVGYGHVTPLTETGKLFCLIYATIGIPLTLVLLSAVVERLMTPVTWLLGTLNAKLGHLYQPFNIRMLHLSIVVAVVFVLIFIVPTAIFTYMETSWNWMDAFYYCFISLTTIGLGDYIPGDDPDIDYRSIYKVATTCYLIFGLIAVMLCLNVFYDIPQLNLGQLFTESRANFGESEKLRSTRNPCYSGPSGLYLPQCNDEIRAVVRIRPHANDDTPSPEETTPIRMP